MLSSISRKLEFIVFELILLCDDHRNLDIHFSREPKQFENSSKDVEFEKLCYGQQKLLRSHCISHNYMRQH